jgi:hypothetical protein
MVTARCAAEVHKAAFLKPDDQRITVGGALLNAPALRAATRHYGPSARFRRADAFDGNPRLLPNPIPTCNDQIQRTQAHPARCNNLVVVA